MAQNEIIDSSDKLQNSISSNSIQDKTIKIRYDDFFEVIKRKNKLSFIECEIEFTNYEINSYEIHSSLSLMFIECNFKNDFKISNARIEKLELKFEDCNFNKNNLVIINISHTTQWFRDFDFNFKNCTNLKELILDKISSSSTLGIKIVSSNDLILNIGYLKRIRIDATINNKKDIYYLNAGLIDNNEIGSTFNSLKVNGCIFEKDLYLNEKTINTIEIENSKFLNKLELIDSSIDKLELKNCSFHDTVKIVDLQGEIKEANFERSTIKGMFFFNGFKDDNLINIKSNSSVSFNHIFLEPTGYLIIRKIKKGKFNFDYANILGQIVMQELDIDSLQMHNASIIGSLIMQKIELNKLDLMNTSLIGKLVFNPTDKDKIFNSDIIQNRETAYLLKKGKQEEGDSISASLFKRKELRLYLNECLSGFYLWKKDKIDELKNLYNKWLKMPSKVLMCILFPFIPFIYILAILSMCLITPIILILNWLKVKRILDKECIVLFFNKISNDFGQSWVRGIIFTMLSAFIFFMFINYFGLGDKKIFIIDGKFDNFGEIWKEYLKILNVLDLNNKSDMIIKVDNIEIIEKNDNLQLTAVGETLFYISKIFVSYGIYQTVSAFRKFGK